MKRNTVCAGVCPICGNTYRGVPAISRTDNITPICPDCGIRQALDSIGVQPEEQKQILEIIHRHTSISGEQRYTSSFEEPCASYDFKTP